MSNIYALEPLLLAHIRATCTSVHFVAGIADSAALLKNSQYVVERPNPVLGADGLGSARYGAVFVCPAADFNAIEQVGTTSEGGCTVTRQRWLLLVATKNQMRLEQANNDQAVPSRQDNGVLTGEVVKMMESFAWSPADWPSARPRLTLNRAATGLPANVYPDVNGLYVTALCYDTEAIN